MLEQAFKNIDDVLWKEAGCSSELDYSEQTSWLLFLKYLDGLEQDRAIAAQLQGKKYAFILDKPYRWEEWAAPKTKDGQIDRNRALTGDDLRDFRVPEGQEGPDYQRNQNAPGSHLFRQGESARRRSRWPTSSGS
jgi:hypothetical protein